MATLALFITLIILVSMALHDDAQSPRAPNPFRHARFKAGLPPEIDE